jgi:hypothetical protein
MTMADAAPDVAPETADRPQPDQTDAPAIVRVGFVIAVLLILLALGLYFLLHLFHTASSIAGANAPLDFRIATPVMDSAPQPQRQAYEAGKQRWLNSYGWIDKPAGIAHIPIEQAIPLLAQGARPAAEPKP